MAGDPKVVSCIRPSIIPSATCIIHVCFTRPITFLLVGVGAVLDFHLSVPYLPILSRCYGYTLSGMYFSRCRAGLWLPTNEECVDKACEHMLNPVDAFSQVCRLYSPVPPSSSLTPHPTVKSRWSKGQAGCDTLPAERVLYSTVPPSLP